MAGNPQAAGPCHRGRYDDANTAIDFLYNMILESGEAGIGPGMEAALISLAERGPYSLEDTGTGASGRMTLVAHQLVRMRQRDLARHPRDCRCASPGFHAASRVTLLNDHPSCEGVIVVAWRERAEPAFSDRRQTQQAAEFRAICAAASSAVVTAGCLPTRPSRGWSSSTLKHGTASQKRRACSTASQ